MDADENTRIIDIWGYLRRLRRHWVVWLALFIAILCGGAVWALTSPSQSEATQTVLVSLPSVGAEAQAMQQTASLAGTVTAYAKLATMPTVADPVLAAHPEVESLAALRVLVEVVPVGPLAIDITAIGPDADATSSLVADLASSLAANAPALLESPDHLRLRLTPADAPVVLDAGSGRLTRLMAAGVLALIVSTGVTGVVESWARRRSS